MGVALYDGDAGTMQLSELPLEPDHALLRQLIAEHRPAVVLTCKGVEESLMQALNEPLDGHTTPNDVRLLKKKEFSEDTAKLRLLALNVEGVPASLADASDRELWVSSIVDFGKTSMIQSAGALLGQCQGSTVPIKLTEMSAAGLVRMDADAFQSLQIFSTEFHPSAAGIGSSKEGFSLFARFNGAKSSGGKKLLRKWFLRPLNTLSVLEDRLDHIEQLRDARHTNVVSQVHSLMSSVKDVRRICAKIMNMTSTCADWLSLRTTLSAVMDLREMTRSMAAESRLRVLTILQNIASGPDIMQLLQLLDAVVDFEQSKVSRKLTVRPGVDPTLDDLKNTYAGLGDLLTRVASAQMDALPETVAIESLSTVYFPMIGYAVVIPRDSYLPVTQQIAAVLPYLEYQFDTESYIYFKSDITKELDNQLGDIHSRIVDRENQCIRELESHILERAELLRRVTDHCAELDCLLSLARSSTELRLQRPILVENAPGLLRISNGRHLLQELTTPTFVPNDTNLGGETTMSLITGPNASGKSVYLKQVGLIAFLAHIGSFVPAESCQIGLMDGIFTRIQTRESATVAKSAFLLDLTQVATMMRHCTERSLLLLDEFGKGTDPMDGAALLGACLEKIAVCKSPCLATTHFSELLTPGMLKLQAPRVQRMSMSFIVRPDLNNEEGVVLLFKLRADDPIDGHDGEMSGSMGTFCARIAGVPASVVARAAQVSTSLARGDLVGRLESSVATGKIEAYRKIYHLLCAFDGVDPSNLIERASSLAAHGQDEE